MPEGDTLHSAAGRLREALVGRSIDAVESPHPRTASERLAERLRGRELISVDVHGKHLFLRFEGRLTLHSHLRMGGAWHVYRRGQRWRRSERRAWLVLRTVDHEVVQFDGPVLELRDDSKLRGEPRIRALGPDILAQDFDELEVVRRLRTNGAGRTVGEALLDQRNVAGIGNVWKSEALFTARVDPWRRIELLGDGEALGIVRAARSLMRDSLAGRQAPRRSGRNVYRRAGRPCRSCATLIRAHGQGDDNRTTFWCPTCQK
jgi:endonuclease VIII